MYMDGSGLLLHSTTVTTTNQHIALIRRRFGRLNYRQHLGIMIFSKEMDHSFLLTGAVPLRMVNLW